MLLTADLHAKAAAFGRPVLATGSDHLGADAYNRCVRSPHAMAHIGRQCNTIFFFSAMAEAPAQKGRLESMGVLQNEALQSGRNGNGMGSWLR